MAGVISKGITLSYGENTLTDLLEIPELGKIFDALETTTLDSSAHTYIDGLENYGDSIAFKFLYQKEQFTTLNALTGEQNWKVSLPDGEAYTFKGSCSVRLDAVGVNAVLTYQLLIRPSSSMEMA